MTQMRIAFTRDELINALNALADEYNNNPELFCNDEDSYKTPEYGKRIVEDIERKLDECDSK